MGNESSSEGKHSLEKIGRAPSVPAEYLGQYHRECVPPTPQSALLQPGAPCGPNAFFTAIANKLDRDYVILADCSGMMIGGLWKKECAVVEELVDFSTKLDSNGVDLIFFSHDLRCFENCMSRQYVADLITSGEVNVSGGRDLAKALHRAFTKHFSPASRGATSILVMTVGTPDSSAEAAAVLLKATNSITSSAELSVSIMQIGGDSPTRSFLKEVDALDAKFDIVDVLTADHLPEDFFSTVHNALHKPHETTKEISDSIAKIRERWWRNPQEAPKPPPTTFAGYQHENV